MSVSAKSIPKEIISLKKSDTASLNSNDDTSLSSSAPEETLEFNDFHYNRHSVPDFELITDFESSLPTDFTLEDEEEPSHWISRTLSLTSGVMQFFRSSSKVATGDEMPETWPDWKKIEKEKVVKIKSNRLKCIPDMLHKLRNVEELRITRSKFKTGDGITSIPISISKLTKLKVLDLRGNPLKTVTLAICHLESLKELVLESCQLTEVPRINELQNLERVILDNNEINDPVFLHSSNITYLSLINNNISEYPRILPHKLISLDMSENLIASIEEPLLSNNTGLTKLYLRENQLECLPASLINLNKLKVLDVSKNCLRQLPDDIGLLESLVNLNVSYNELTTLPRSITNLSDCKTHLLCGENPLQKPPIEIGLQGLASITNYFKALDNSEEIKNKRLKLMLLGDGRAGKTFLAKALSTCHEPEACSDETIGIDCFHWRYRYKDEDTLEVLIVDCAGQKKYMLTHQIFLSTGMIFAVVVNLSAYQMSEYREKIGFWIDLIIARVPNATILIVPTHLDLMLKEDEVVEKCRDIILRASDHVTTCKAEARKKSIDTNIDGEENDENDDDDVINPILPKLLKFSSLEDPSDVQIMEIIGDEDDKHTIHLIPVSSRFTLPGLSLLRDEIVKIANNKELCPHIHRCVPESWQKLEQFCVVERTKRERHPIMTIEELEVEANCLSEGEDYKEALRFIDSMGHILFFESEEGSSDLVLLDPRWLFQLMKLLFTHNSEGAFVYHLDYCKKFDMFKTEFNQAKNALINSALLSRHLLQCIWSEHISEKKLFDQVTSLFRRFDLFYEVTNPVLPSDEKFLVSWFMKDHCPPDIKMPEQDKKALIVTRFETIGVLPEGFFQRFIIRMYAEHILDSCSPWNCGFKGLVQDGDIICESTKSDCSSIITLRAFASPKSIYHMWRTIIPILNVLEKFMKDWKGIKHLVFSVCPSCSISNQQHPSVWRLDTTKTCNQPTIHCQTELDRVDKWLIYPPPGILSNYASCEEKERFNREDMEDGMSYKMKNKISEYLSTDVRQLQRILDVHLGESARSTDSRNQALEAIKLWEQKSEKVSKRLFIDALREMRPYPHDVIQCLMS